MKFAIMGDIHANLEALLAVVDHARNQGCTRFACVGDLVGYNANPGECVSVIRQLEIPCVKGNHDEYASVGDPLEGLNPRALTAIHWTRLALPEADKAWLRELRHVRLVSNFTIVHATLDAPQRWEYIFDRLAAATSFTYQNTPVCFFGHTHLPIVFSRIDGIVRKAPFTKFKVEPGVKYLVNVGSVGEPRDGNPLAAYAIYDLAEGTVELNRVPYDDFVAEAKACRVGLPPRRPR